MNYDPYSTHNLIMRSEVRNCHIKFGVGNKNSAVELHEDGTQAIGGRSDIIFLRIGAKYLKKELESIPDDKEIVIACLDGFLIEKLPKAEEGGSEK